MLAPDEARALARLDHAIGRAFETRDQVVVAFSGGLGSLVMAGLARKHGDLRCVVVGTRGSSDLCSAIVARDFLDYRLETLTPRSASVLRMARTIHAEDPARPVAEVLDLVPLAMVRAVHSKAAVLSGFDLSRFLPRKRSRNRVLRFARELAIPDGFSLAPHRSPAEGSGVGPLVRALGHARHRSPARLLLEPR